MPYSASSKKNVRKDARERMSLIFIALARVACALSQGHGREQRFAVLRGKFSNLFYPSYYSSHLKILFFV